MMAHPASVPDKPEATHSLFQSVLDRCKRLLEKTQAEGGVRLAHAKTAFAAELAWQEETRRPSSLPSTRIASAVLSGVLVDPTTKSFIALQEGINMVSGVSVVVEKGSAHLLGETPTTYWSNDTIKLREKTYLLKLFPSHRCAPRAFVKEQV